MCSEDGLCPAMMVSIQRGWFMNGEVHVLIEWYMYREEALWRGYPYKDSPSTKIMMYIEII